MMTDPIADMLTRIRNAQLTKQKQVVLPNSKTKLEIARILKEEGYVRSYDVVAGAPQSTLRIQLRYDETRRPIITGLRRVSKPGRRIYKSRQEIPWVQSGSGHCHPLHPQGLDDGA